MPIYEFDGETVSEPSEQGSSEPVPADQVKTDEVTTSGNVKPISVTAQDRDGGTQYKVTLPKRFAELLDIDGDDYVLMQLTEDEHGNENGILVEPPER